MASVNHWMDKIIPLRVILKSVWILGVFSIWNPLPSCGAFIRWLAVGELLISHSICVISDTSNYLCQSWQQLKALENNTKLRHVMLQGVFCFTAYILFLVFPIEEIISMTHGALKSNNNNRIDIKKNEFLVDTPVSGITVWILFPEVLKASH